MQKNVWPEICRRGRHPCRAAFRISASLPPLSPYSSAPAPPTSLAGLPRPPCPAPPHDCAQAAMESAAPAARPALPHLPPSPPQPRHPWLRGARHSRSVTRLGMGVRGGNEQRATSGERNTALAPARSVKNVGESMSESRARTAAVPREVRVASALRGTRGERVIRGTTRPFECAVRVPGPTVPPRR